MIRAACLLLLLLLVVVVAIVAFHFILSNTMLTSTSHSGPNECFTY